MDKIYYELTINKKEELNEIVGNFISQKGISGEFNKLKCYRCGNENLVSFNDTLYCKNCIEFGRVDKNTVFYKLKQKENRLFKYSDRLGEIKLTSKQRLASKFIYSSYKAKEDCLIHAVCGAGKTEITFSTISNTLKANKYVCFAIPRIDIIYDVAKRLKYFFGETKICILNSQEEKIQNGQLYVMTTNQIIKFKDAFDLIIVDEIDAFPYEYNLKYDYGVQCAKKSSGIIIYLTSTPSEKFLKKKLNTFVINTRWHGYKLPEPIFEYFNINEFIVKGNEAFINKIKSYEKVKIKKQLLIFISNINRGKQVYNILKKNKINLNFVYSQEPNRRDNVEEFTNKKSKILLTTTILERGVTFENIDVIVLDTSNTLYTKASLIQIAGRVGRKKEYQNGKVYFYYMNITKVMKEARKSIIKLNNK